MRSHRRRDEFHRRGDPKRHDLLNGGCGNWNLDDFVNWCDFERDDLLDWGGQDSGFRDFVWTMGFQRDDFLGRGDPKRHDLLNGNFL